jgi:hypothetical protein
MAPAVLEHPEARTTRRHLMATEESSACAHPSTKDHDDTVGAHYASLERLGSHACYEGVVYIGHLVEEDGEETEVYEAVACRRCAEEAR